MKMGIFGFCGRFLVLWGSLLFGGWFFVLEILGV